MVSDEQFRMLLSVRSLGSNFELLTVFNPLIPEFLKWTLQFLSLDMSIDANRGFSLNQKEKK